MKTNLFFEFKSSGGVGSCHRGSCGGPYEVEEIFFLYATVDSNRQSERPCRVLGPVEKKNESWCFVRLPGQCTCKGVGTGKMGAHFDKQNGHNTIRRTGDNKTFNQRVLDVKRRKRTTKKWRDYA